MHSAHNEGVHTSPSDASAALEAAAAAAQKVSPDPFPDVIWVSIKTGTREEGEMEDRAASFISRENLIKVNEDFQGFKDIENHIKEQYKVYKTAESQVPIVIKQLFQQQLMESVATALSFRNRPQWNPDDFDRATSDEALTLAVGSRYYLMTEAKRLLSTCLGKPEGLDG